MAELIVAAVKVAVWVFTSNSIAALVVRTVVMVGLSSLASKLAARDAARSATAAAGVEQQRQAGALVFRTVGLGPCVMFGSEAALLASGNGDDNRTNWRALVMSDWPCRAQRVWVNGTQLTFAGDINAGWQPCDQYRAKNGQPRLWMRWLTGDWEQEADPELMATGSFTSEDRLRGLAVLVIKRQYDADAFPNGPPDGQDLRVEVDGAPVYDWRDPEQSLTDVRTWKPSTNPVVLAENFLCLLRAPAQLNPGTTEPIVGPGLMWSRRGGRAAFRARLTAMANICDALVGGVPRYRAALAIRSDQTGEQVLTLLADACGGAWVGGPSGGMLVPGHVPAPCRTITTGEYQRGYGISWNPWQAPDQAINTLQVTGPDLDRAGELDTMTVVDEAAVIADGGENPSDLDLSACPWAEQRWRVGWRKYRLERLGDTRQITVAARHMDLLPYDVIVAPDDTLPADVSAAWWQLTGQQEAVAEEGHVVTLSMARVDASVDGPVPPMGAVADFDPPPLAPELAVPTVSVVASPLVVGAAITPRWLVSLAADAVQAHARVMLQGPAATADAIGSAPQLVVDVARGGQVPVPSGPGWWRWRATGRDGAGRQGPWGSWSSAVQETQAVVAGEAAAVPWPAVTDPGGTRPEDGATRNRINPATPAPGDFRLITDGGLPVWQYRDGTLWQTVANLVTGTDQIADTAGLGETAVWSGVGDRPANLAGLAGTEAIRNDLLVPDIDALDGRATAAEARLTAASDINLLPNGLWSRGAVGWVAPVPLVVFQEGLWNRPMVGLFPDAAEVWDRYISSECEIRPWAAGTYGLQFQGYVDPAGTSSQLFFYVERRRASDGVWSFGDFFHTLAALDFSLRQYTVTVPVGHDRLRVVWAAFKRATGAASFRLGPAMVSEWRGAYPPLNEGAAIQAVAADLRGTDAALSDLSDTVAGMLAAPYVTVSTREIASSGTTNITTSEVTATMGGASGSVTYEWVRLSGPASHVALSPSSATTQFRRSGTIPAGAEETSSWQVTATDAAGRSASAALRVDFNSEA